MTEYVCRGLIFLNNIPDDYDFQDFEIEGEGWSIYRVEDGTVIKLRIFLSAVSKARPDPNNPDNIGYELSLSPVNTVAMPAPKNRGNPTPGKFTPKQLQESIVKEDMEFTTIQEPWNVYCFKDRAKLSIRIQAVKISKTDKYDAKGIPVYFINHQPQIKTTLPPELKKKQVKITSQPPSSII